MTAKSRNIRQLKQNMTCGKKKGYPNKTAARDARKHLKATTDGTWDLYKCLTCDLWHVGGSLR